MNVLLTRSLQDSLETAKQLLEHKINTAIEPLISVKHLPHKDEINNFQNIVITSKNAAHIVNKASSSKKLRIFAVGKKTAEYIKSALKNNLIIAEGNVESLIEEIKNNMSGEILYYPRGEVISIDLKQELAAANIEVKEEITYRIEYKKELSLKLQKQIENQEITDAVFFSQESLDNFLSISFMTLKKSVLKMNFVVPLNSEINPEMIGRIKRFKVGDIRSLIDALGI